MRTLSDAEIDALAARFSALVTQGFVEILEQHARAGDEWEDVVWNWRNHHSLAVKQGAVEFLRGLAGPHRSAT